MFIIVKVSSFFYVIAYVIQDIVGEFENQYILCVEYSNRIYSNMIYVPLLYIELNFAGEKLKIF